MAIVYVNGISGSGKSTVAKYLEARGFSRIGFDDCVEEFLTGRYGLELQGILGALFKENPWEHFIRDRDSSPYTLETAREQVIKPNLSALQKWQEDQGFYPFTTSDKEHLFFAYWNAVLERLADLEGHVVLDGISRSSAIQQCFQERNDPDMHLLYIDVDDETAIRNNIAKGKGWSREISEARVRATRRYADECRSVALAGLVEHEIENNETLDELKRKIDERFREYYTIV